MLSLDDLTPEQVSGIDFLYEGDESLLLADVGTGKTIMALTALQRFIFEGIATRALIIAPKFVCTNVWVQEVAEWSHINLHGVCVAGLTEKKRVTLLENPEPFEFVCINYELLPWLMLRYPEGLEGFDVVIMDEVDKMKDRTTRRFSGKRKNKKTGDPGHCGMRTWRRNFNIRIGMTGTPASNGLLDLWAETYVIDGGTRLEPTFIQYRNRYFYQTDYMGYAFAVLPEREPDIYDAISDITYRIKKKTGEGFIPPTVDRPPRYLELPDKAAKLYSSMERDYIAFLHKAKTGTVKAIEAENAAVVYGKLRQLAAGFLYSGPEEDPSSEYEWLTTTKFDALDDLISELQGNQLMIVYHFQAQLIELRRRYKKKFKYLGGGVSGKKADETIEQWNSGELQLLGMHPASAAHGLNLQKSHAHHIACLTEPQSAGLYTQIVGRLARTGNQAGAVFVHHLSFDKTVDMDDIARTQGKVFTQDVLLAAMEARNDGQTRLAI